MRKMFRVVVVIFFAGSATVLVSGILKKIQEQSLIAEKISRLPHFSYMTLTKESFNSSEIRSGPVLIIRFHPECEHCIYEISEIMKSRIPFSGFRILMISTACTDSIKKFFSGYNLSDYPAITALADTLFSFGEIFGSDIVPSNYIYNRELSLVKVVHGEVSTETILRYMQDNEQVK
jgi:hypothetical protein